jgi:hypothetical protein
MRHISAVRMLAASAAVAVASACAPSASATPPPPEIGTPTPVEDVSTVHLPIEDYMLTPTQSIERDYVASVLVSDCMRRFGFDYPPGVRPAADGSSAAVYSVTFRRYGVTDAEIARTWGYHVPRPNVPAHPAKMGKISSLSPAERRVLTGTDSANGPLTHEGRSVPAGGCLAEGNRMVLSDEEIEHLGPQPAGSGIVATIKSESFQDSTADPRITEVFSKWSACMANKGYRISDPLQATVPVSSLDDPIPSRAEIIQAETDVACKKKTNLVGTWFAVETAYQDRAIKRNARQLERVRGERDEEAERINELYAIYVK